MSDDTPTQRFDVPAADGHDEPEEKKSRAVMIALIIVGAVLLLAIIVLVIVLAARGTGSPSAGQSTTSSASSTQSDTPSATPSATPTPTQTATTAPPPPSNDPVINSFTTSSKTVRCNTSAPQGDHQLISFAWSTSKAATVYFGVDTDDASANSLFDNLPPSGNSNDDFPDGYNHGTYEYPCTALMTKFTLTVVADNGHKVSKSITIANNGDH